LGKASQKILLSKKHISSKLSGNYCHEILVSNKLMVVFFEQTEGGRMTDKGRIIKTK
jgi:hypothetical protein